jgi:hypothetical protein
MVEIEGISISIKADAGGVSAGLQQAGTAVKTFGTDLQKTGADAKTLGTNMTASAGAVKESGTRMEGSMKGLALGMSQTMTSAFSLYQSFDNIEKKQYALEKATLASKKATEAVDQAQKDYNETVEKYGADSAEAQDALDKLNLSKEAAALADEREKISQNNVNDSMMTAGLTVIPGVISGIDGLTRTWKTFSGLDPAGLAGKLKDAFSGLGSDKIGILAGVGFGFGSVLTTFKALTAKTKEEKNLWTGLAMAMNALTAATWALNIAKAVGLTLSTLGMGALVVAAAGIAAAATWALASQYGAEVEPPPEDLSTTPPSGEKTPPSTPTATRKPTGELPSVTPGAGMKTGEEMAGAGLGEYIEETGTFIPSEEALVRDDVAFKVSQGPNAGKYKWLRKGVAKGTYFSMEDLKRIQAGQYTADYEQDLRPWFTYGFEERADELGNVYLVGRHFQKGGLILGDTLGMIHRDEAVLPLTDTRAMDSIAAAIGGGGGGTVIQNFYINGAKDVDLVMNEIANRMRTIRGVGH